MDWFIGHLVGDYLLQNDWMATNKKKATWPCAVHCFLWSVSVMACAMWPLWTFPILFLSHFAQDRTELVLWLMTHKGQKQFAAGLGPWSVIVVDNCLHLFLLWVVSKMV